ncbi:MAG: tRNA (guanosine(46)-N7)-methyltransferase TrmB [Deltaproteobacteria bacterium]|nr:tRNA (guanosine(46)-N7)-methyltransferase TrmB [Deltaproteobacteria bacterium]
MPIAHHSIDVRVRMPFVYPATLSLTGRRNLIVDIGPGRGDFLFHLAREYPDQLAVGIEIKSKRADKLIQRIELQQLTNAVVIQDDARQALPRFFAEGQVATIHINFPDPWPKRSHSKNRLIQPEFVAECIRVLQPGGALFFTTDVEWYAAAVAKEIASVGAIRKSPLQSCYPEGITTSSPDAFPTYFSQKWQREGRTIFYQKYRRR